MINAPFADLYKLVVSDITAVRCAWCANVLPRCAFNKNCSSKTGLEYSCKQCRKECRKQFREAHTMSDITDQRCGACANVLPRSAFHKNLATKTGLDTKCKQCRKEVYTNPHARRLRNEYQRKRYREDEKYREKNIDASRKSFQRNYSNPEYRKKKLASNAKYCKAQLASNTAFKIKKILRNRVNKALKRHKKKAVKSAKTCNLLGCTIPFFMKHIEKQFKSGMSWENQGQWHVDHIRPCASFDLTQPEQQRICFNYKNLQPLWAADNMKKGAKLDYQVDDNTQRI